MIKVATWNVNSIKARLPNLMDWMNRAAPDVVLLQETKVQDADFPYLEAEAMGYRVAVRGQKTYNGVAILSRVGFAEVIKTLPGDPENGEARYIEARLDNGLRVASIYVPMGQSPQSDRFPFKLSFLEAVNHRARDLLAFEEAFILGGDYNVAPEAADVYDPEAWDGHILFHPEERARLRRLFHLGLTDAFRTLHAEPHSYTWWDYRAGAWQRDMGLRIDHLLLSPQAADRLVASGVDRWCRDREKCSDHAPVWCDLA